MLPVSGTLTTPGRNSPRADAALTAPEGVPVMFVEVDNGTENPLVLAHKAGRYREFFRRTVKPPAPHRTPERRQGSRCRCGRPGTARWGGRGIRRRPQLWPFPRRPCALGHGSPAGDRPTLGKARNVAAPADPDRPPTPGPVRQRAAGRRGQNTRRCPTRPPARGTARRVQPSSLGRTPYDSTRNRKQAEHG
ncbi:replication-relaxation family protein [Streptomyces sp. NPDC001219]